MHFGLITQESRCFSCGSVNGKALTVLLISVFNSIAIYWILGMELSYMGMYGFLSLIVILTMVIIGAVLGLLVPNQAAAGIASMPVLMIFFMLPLAEEGPAARIAQYLPNHSVEQILARVFTGEAANIFSTELLTVGAWIVASIIAFVLAFNKKGLDD